MPDWPAASPSSQATTEPGACVVIEQPDGAPVPLSVSVAASCTPAQTSPPYAASQLPGAVTVTVALKVPGEVAPTGAVQISVTPLRPAAFSHWVQVRPPEIGPSEVAPDANARTTTSEFAGGLVRTGRSSAHSRAVA